MNTKTLSLLSFIIVLCSAAQQIQLKQPSPVYYNDKPQVISMAKEQSFTLPFKTRTYRPDSRWIHPTAKIYYPVATASLFSALEDEIVAVLPLPFHEKVFLVDEKHNLGSYSIDQHSMLDKLSPGRAMLPPEKQHIATMALAATSDERFVFYITPSHYKAFETESLGLTEVQEGNLEGDIVDIQKAVVHRDYLVVLSRQSGVKIFKVTKEQKLILVQVIEHEQQDTLYADFQIERSSDMLYILCLNRPSILVYHFKPSQFPNSDKTFTIFVHSDEINTAQITNKHTRLDERNRHLDLAVSSKRQEQTLMILFMHSYHHVVAEIVYDAYKDTWAFVRYFKFATAVKQIFITKDALVVLASDTIGVFPIGIHPRLIEEELNGKVSLSRVSYMTVLPGGNVISITDDSIEYATVHLDEETKLNCELQHPSRLRSVKVYGNLTACSIEDRTFYESYCTFYKQLQIKEMQLTVSARFAENLSIGLVIFVLVIIGGICMLYVMKKRKQRQIEQLEMFFEARKRQQIQRAEGSNIS